MLLKVGEKVRLSQLGRLKYSDHYRNPHAGRGVIIRVLQEEEYAYQVAWDTYSNDYTKGDLEIWP